MSPQQIEIRAHLQRARAALHGDHPNFGPLFDLLCAAIDVNTNVVRPEGRVLFAPTKLAKLAFKLNPRDELGSR